MPEVTMEKQNSVSRLPASGSFRRFLAKLTDAAVCSAFFALLYKIVPFVTVSSVYEYAAFLLLYSELALSLTMLLESAFYLAFGTTPGKYCFGVCVVHADGTPASPSVYLIHSLYSWIFGSALAIPLLRWIAWIVHAVQVHYRGETGYDGNLHLKVLARTGYPRRITAGIFLIVLAGALTSCFLFVPLFSELKNKKLSRYELPESAFDELYWDEDDSLR